ncbi:MAG: SDR family oxidoreductase [Rhizobiales bacterium]|nr:SDR family oxidoreductase [Hyphomicrobiales bacterium]
MSGNGAFEGKVAVVTGAARGIGEAIAVALRDEGARVFSIDLGEPEAPQDGVRYLSGDVGDPAAIAAAFAAVDAEAGRLDVLVNNAGIQRVALGHRMDFAEWNGVIATHLNGMFLCAGEAIRRMRPQRKGAIVSIASVAGIVGIPGRGPYSAAKAAIMSLTRVLALENATADIRVNAVAPGYTRTKLIDQALKDGSLRSDWQLERVPMKRLAEPSEIADVVLFLASDKASYVTGQTLVVDGGWTIQGVHHVPDWLDADKDDG